MTDVLSSGLDFFRFKVSYDKQPNSSFVINVELSVHLYCTLI